MLIWNVFDLRNHKPAIIAILTNYKLSVYCIHFCSVCGIPISNLFNTDQILDGNFFDVRDGICDGMKVAIIAELVRVKGITLPLVFNVMKSLRCKHTPYNSVLVHFTELLLYTKVIKYTAQNRPKSIFNILIISFLCFGTSMHFSLNLKSNSNIMQHIHQYNHT